jgi:hypothetical protein
MILFYDRAKPEAQWDVRISRQQTIHTNRGSQVKNITGTGGNNRRDQIVILSRSSIAVPPECVSRPLA